MRKEKERRIMIDILQTIGMDMWHTTMAMSPYLLFGFLMAGILSALISPETVERHLGRLGFASVFKASAFGVPLPLCSCGVIPVGTSLRRHGASKGAATAFLISTPQTGVDSIMVTFSLLGPLLAVVRPIVAFLAGLLGGVLVDAVDANGNNGGDAPVEPCTDACCSTRDTHPLLWRILHYGFVVLTRDLAKALIIGIIIAGILHAIPIKEMLGEELRTGVGGMLFLLLFSIPLYICATASVPMAYALLTQGFSPGAVLVFLMAGPATNAATIAAILKVMGGRITSIYVGTIAVVAFLAGAVMDYMVPNARQLSELPKGWELPGWVGTSSAVALILILANAMRPTKSEEESEAHSHEESVVLSITGMTCGHCAKAVEDALRACDGVGRVTVDLQSEQATIMGANACPDTLIAAVESVGFRAEQAASGSDASCHDHC
jgi:uncharacterized protein